MKPYIRQLVAKQLKRLGWNRKPNESHFDRLLRPIIIGLAATADEPSVVKKCKELFADADLTKDISPDLQVVTSKQNIKRGAEIDPDLRGAVFGTVARLGGAAEFKKLLELHNSSTLSEERTTLSAALTGFEQPKLYNQALELITSETVRLQDVAYWVAYSFLNRHARISTWKWLKDHWGWLESNLGSDLSFYRMPIYSARVFSDPKFLKDYQTFFKAHMSPALERSFKQGLEILQYQAAWKERDLKEVKHFFKQQ